jgi:cytochrome c biogenesis protein CcdA
VTELALALAAGMLTVAAPCVLPMLPILLGASLGPSGADASVGRARPVAIVDGFVATFAALGVVLGRLAEAAGAAPNALRPSP